MRSAFLILALLVVGASCALVTPPALAAADPAVAALRIDAFAGSPVRRTIRLGVVIGACTTSVEVARLVQRRTSVQIRLTQTVSAPPVTDVPTICPAVGIFRCLSVVLDRPLGKRALVDLTSGTRFTLGSTRTPRSFGVGRFKTCAPPGRVTQ